MRTKPRQHQAFIIWFLIDQHMIRKGQMMMMEGSDEMSFAEQFYALVRTNASCINGKWENSSKLVL